MVQNQIFTLESKSSAQEMRGSQVYIYIFICIYIYTPIVCVFLQQPVLKTAGPMAVVPGTGGGWGDP